MDSNEKNGGAGSGGGPATSHNDIKFIDGEFARAADRLQLLAFTDKQTAPNVRLIAAGEGGYVVAQGERHVLITTGRWGDGTIWPPHSVQQSSEIIVAATADGDILLQRGSYDDNNSQHIRLSEGWIWINSGTNGGLSLQSGTSRIELTPTSITIQAETVNINPH
jgi:hypothetical protein